MKDLFPYNDTKSAYVLFLSFLRENHGISLIKGRARKDSFEIFLNRNYLNSEIVVENFNRNSYCDLELTFRVSIGTFTPEYHLSGWEINSRNIKRLLRLCSYSYVPKCPKCGSIPSKYYEQRIYKSTYSTDLTGNPYIYRYTGTKNEKYQSLKLEAQCHCGYKWKIPKVISSFQIRETSIPSEKFSAVIHDPTRILTPKEIDELLSIPSMYAKFENKKPNRTGRLTKIEINELLRETNAGENEE